MNLYVAEVKKAKLVRDLSGKGGRVQHASRVNGAHTQDLLLRTRTLTLDGLSSGHTGASRSFVHVCV